MKWGTRVTALVTATLASGVGFAGVADAAGPPVYAKYTVTGTTHLAKPGADLRLGPGQFDMYTQIGSYTFFGTFTMPPVRVTKVVPGLGTVSGTVTLGPGDAAGSVFGSFSGSATWPVRLSDVRVNGVPYDVGASCATVEPVTTELVPDGFVPGEGGRLTSTYALGGFANCGSATPLVNAAGPGPGNTLALDLTAG